MSDTFGHLYGEPRAAGDMLHEHEDKCQELKSGVNDFVDVKRIIHSEVNDYNRKIEIVRDRNVGVLLFEVPQVDRSHAARYRYITPPRYCSTANETAHVAVLIWRI